MIKIIGGKIVLHENKDQGIKFAFPVDALVIREKKCIDGERKVLANNLVCVAESFDDILEAIEKHKNQPVWFGIDMAKPPEDEVQPST